ncbi:restriction endonuclease subunit S [Levilactobacillus brevis]|uniref:restriction endonuclease subunit S n=1 Tax=Levilactobacillus brevis TaxID=1580 RepID=UPI0021A65C6A|nr:restriction endonuclease subunit S [Levilactobacillus brevis]MCT3582136.1 restriction endonuclease subunit S [Levilactobacillus brevis]
MKDNQAKYPQLRFKGFTDPWEERKLSSISERVTRKNKNNESTLPLTISAQDGLVDQNDFFNKQVASRDVTGYFLVKNGEFAYNKSYSNGYPWGAIKRLDKYDMGVLSTLYIVFRPTKINSQFLVSYYDTTRWYREVSKNAAEGARNHGLLNIAPTDFFNTLLVVPKIVDEQQKIGSFFKQLDDTIALHQRKLAKLKELKQGYLQKMFPKNGAKVPELRFAGFADDWEVRKLEELTLVLTGFPFKNEDFVDNGKYLVITNRNIQNESSTVDVSLGNRVADLSDEIKERYYLNKNDILVTMDGTVGRTAKVVDDNMILAQRVARLVANKNTEFVYQWLNQGSFFNEMTKVSHGGTIKHISLNEISNYSATVPSNNIEQQKIGSFFKQFDNTIDLHQRKLEKLQELKKGYLQKMFC